MTPRNPAASSVPPWTLAVAAMLSVQLGSALSVPLIDTVGAAGTGLAAPDRRGAGVPGARPTSAAVGPAVRCAGAARSRRDQRARHDLLPRLARADPLGTAVAVEFLGPLTVAAVRSHSTRALVWPGLALLGVVGLTEPWRGTVDLAGLGFAALGAVGWAGHIVLTQQVGDRFTGVTALSMTVPIAAVTAAVVGVPQAAGHLSLEVVAAAAGLALLFPVLQYALVMLALRRITPTAFGTLMALEPAMGLVLGLLVLSQQPSPIQIAAIALVVLAGAGAQRGGGRTASTGTPQDQVLLPLNTLEPR